MTGSVEVHPSRSNAKTKRSASGDTIMLTYMYMRYVGGGIGHYKVEIGDEEGTAGEGEDIGLGPEGDSEPEEADNPVAKGEDVEPRVPVNDDEVDNTEEHAHSDSSSDSEDSRGSRASSTSDDESGGDDGGDDGEDSNDESSVDLGAEDGEGYMEEEEEEGYALL
ncbi:hypothetical protein C8R45DRAFT_935136 [Mycena sanguinolenta]|nr:hypothetical protein C8R45DRAFT_935136 [Mycena sanguinolenta]